MILLPNTVISNEFDNYLGDLPAYMLIYDSSYNVLYERNTRSTFLPSRSDVLKERGTGVLSVNNDAGNYIMLHTTDSSRGLHYVLVMDKSVFYARGIAIQRPIFIMIILLIIILLGMISIFTFYNYKPINDLLTYVTGQMKRPKSENEITFIKSRYDEVIGEAETLSLHLQELTPLVARTFINRLIFGRITNEEEFAFLSKSANIMFTGQYNVALYVSIRSDNNQDSLMSRITLLAWQFHINSATIVVGELPSESAICLIVNFDCSEEKLPSIGTYFANDFIKLLNTHDIPSIRIGVGMIYENPIQISDSFAEACASAQFAPLGNNRVFSYQQTQLPEDNEQGNVFYHINAIALLLMIEGINRGKYNIALRAFNEILEGMSSSSASFVFFRFNCSQLLSRILKHAEELDITISKEQIDNLLAFNNEG